MFRVERRRQRLAAVGQRQIVGRRAAIERLAERLHPLRHGEIADPDFAQIIVDIAAEIVEQRLARTPAPSGPTLRIRRNTSHRCNTIMSNRPLTVSATPKLR